MRFSKILAGMTALLLGTVASVRVEQPIEEDEPPKKKATVAQVSGKRHPIRAGGLCGVGQRQGRVRGRLCQLEDGAVSPDILLDLQSIRHRMHQSVRIERAEGCVRDRMPGPGDVVQRELPLQVSREELEVPRRVRNRGQRTRLHVGVPRGKGGRVHAAPSSRM